MFLASGVVPASFTGAVAAMAAVGPDGSIKSPGNYTGRSVKLQ